MKAKKIESYCSMIQNIRYDNEHGGRYAYVQFMAYSRELIKLLRPVRNTERQIEAIEGLNWLFNEYLGVRFTHRQKAIFDTNMLEMKEVVETLRHAVRDAAKSIHRRHRTVRHAQAA